MIFNSIHFLIFFPVVLLIYFCLPKKLSNFWLLFASYFFYMCWSPVYVLLLIISTISTYCGALIIGKNKKKSVRTQKCILLFVIIVNLAILIYFKYSNFLLNNLYALLRHLGLFQINAYKIDLLFPLGISFYTFQALGYLIDVYRGNTSVEKNIINYALFVSFFPTIGSGPIERANSLLSQIHNRQKMSYDNVVRGFYYMVWGFFVKMVIADRIAILADNVFLYYYSYGTIELALGAIGYTIQIYCDFMGYSMIALGTAKMLGINVIDNFNCPYFARSIKEFWRRWHISLSTWFRDYVYIPLGGNRCGRFRKHVNTMITFLLSGIWHGANWTFLVWGGVHGLYQMIGSETKQIREKLYKKMGINLDGACYDASQRVTTFLLVALAWILFRSENISSAMEYIYRMFTRPNIWVLFDQSIYNIGLSIIEMNVLCISLLVLLCVSIVKYHKGVDIYTYLDSQGTIYKCVFIIILIIFIVIFGIYGGEYDETQFIYFQF